MSLMFSWNGWLFATNSFRKNKKWYFWNLQEAIIERSALGSLDETGGSTVHLRRLSEALKELLVLWFSVGFLHLQRVTWESSCAMMEKVPYVACNIFLHGCMLPLISYLIFSLIDNMFLLNCKPRQLNFIFSQSSQSLEWWYAVYKHNVV